MLLFLRKLNYQIILWKKHYQTREIEKRFCFLWKQFYWKEILSLAAEHSGKPPSSCFSFTFLNFFYENSTWMISHLSLNHFIKHFWRISFTLFEIVWKLWDDFSCVAGSEYSEILPTFCEVEQSFQTPRGKQNLELIFLFRFFPQDGVSGQIISKTWSSIV